MEKNQPICERCGKPKCVAPVNSGACPRPEPLSNPYCHDEHKTHPECFTSRVEGWQNELDMIWERGHIPEWASDVKAGIKGIVNRALKEVEEETFARAVGVVEPCGRGCETATESWPDCSTRTIENLRALREEAAKK